MFHIIVQYNAMNKSRCSNKLLETAANLKNALLTFLPKSSFNAIQLTMSKTTKSSVVSCTQFLIKKKSRTYSVVNTNGERKFEICFALNSP